MKTRIDFSAEIFRRYADQISEDYKQGEPPTAELIREIITKHEVLATLMRESYERYRTDEWAVPIFRRELAVESNKINNKLANDFFSEIVDTKTGYMFGIPVTTKLDKSMVEGGTTGYDKLAIEMQRFRNGNSLADMDSEMCKFAAIAGYDTAMAYIDEDGKERVMRVPPWEGIILTRTEITNPLYGIRYYKMWDDKGRVEFRDKTHVHIYESAGTDFGVTYIKSEPHLYDYCPHWGVPNNAELLGDVDKVVSLIDAYDRTMSDMNSEIEQFRLAYMLFFGVEPDEEMMENLRRTGAIYVPPTDNQETANNISFLTKQMNHQAVDSHLDRLEDNISRFARHVNFTDEQFGGNLSGVAMKYKLFGLETKSKYFERKHDAATKYMYKVIASAWAKKGIILDWTTIENQYTRNVAISLVEEAQVMAQLKGIISNRTLFSLFSAITDVDAEEEQIQREKEESVDLDSDIGGNNDDTVDQIDPLKPDGTKKTLQELAAEAEQLKASKAGKTE